MVTISEIKIGKDAPGGAEIDYYEADVVTAGDYYPFGMGMPGRKFSASGLYRYGFNGKENDNEVKGEGNQQDYGMRIYDPRLGRFLSVDPLTKGFPWYTPYQFAGNRPIIAIDLDGAEELVVIIFSHPADGKPGKAKIEVTLDYKVVTSGEGSITRPDLIDDKQFSELYANGNGTLNLSTLPTPEIQMEEATKKLVKKGAYYETEVVFNYTIDASPGQDFGTVAAWVDENKAGRGLIGTPLEDDEYDGSFTTTNTTKYFSHLIRMDKTFEKSRETGGAGATENILSAGNNIVLMNPLYYNIDAGKKFRFETGATSTELIVHEVGHNSARSARHTSDGSGDYEYHQQGLQSNERKRIYNSSENVQNIINDTRNRSTIKTTDLTKPKG